MPRVTRTADRGRFLLGTVLALAACGPSRERVLIGPMWARQCRTADGTGVVRQTRQVGPLFEVGNQTTVGAGYLDRWVLIGVDRSAAKQSNEPADDPRADCAWTFGFVRRESAGENDEVFVSRTEAGVMSGVGRELLGLNIGFNRTTAVRVPNDTWLVLNASAGDPPRSTVMLERAVEGVLEDEKEGEE